MRKAILFLVLLFVGSLTGCGSTPVQQDENTLRGKYAFSETVRAHAFYKGDLTVIETSQAERQLAWYRNNGYTFVPLENAAKYQEKNKDIVLIESQRFESNPFSLSAICVDQKIDSKHFTKESFLNQAITHARAHARVLMINHPNKEWGLDQSSILSADNFELLEIASGRVHDHDRGNSSHPSVEETWDRYMTERHRLLAASAEHLSNQHEATTSVHVWADDLNEAALCNALRNGQFYVARGAKLSALMVNPTSIEIGVTNWKPSHDRVDFIGASGRLLARVTANPAHYDISGGEGYVRAHVFQPRGTDPKDLKEAWTQAYFIRVVK